jgi:hypothetical protein
VLDDELLSAVAAKTQFSELAAGVDWHQILDKFQFQRNAYDQWSDMVNGL